MSKSGKIVHVCNLDKFIPPFIDFVEEHFDDFEERHVFWVRGDQQKYAYRPRKNTISASLDGIGSMFSFIRVVNSADKIILHGLFLANQVRWLSVMPWLHKKCHWVIWGGDLYGAHLAKRTIKWRINEVFRRWLIPRIGHLITHIGGDVDLAREKYGARGNWHECFLYTSNLFQEYKLERKPDSITNILVGNSADPSNNHERALEALIPHRNENIQIYMPLSYGNQNHAIKMVELGDELFGKKFTAVTKFMKIDEYLKFLANIDIAVFNHRRQQAMGNITMLLGLGKTVFLREGVSSSIFFRGIGVVFFNAENFEMAVIDEKSSIRNKQIIKNYFSEKNLIMSWRRIFDERG